MWFQLRGHAGMQEVPLVTKSLSLESLMREFKARTPGIIDWILPAAFHAAANEWDETLRYDPETGRVFYKDTAIVLGDIFSDVDGYEKFFPRIPDSGYWRPVELRAIADLVDELNQEWDRKIQEYFDAAETTQPRLEPPGPPASAP